MQLDATAARPVYLTREGSVFRLAFSYDARLVERAQLLPFAAFDRATRSWTTAVCAQSVAELRRWFYDGLCDVDVDSLLAPGEDPPPAAEAVLRSGTINRPYVVAIARRGNDALFARLRAVPGAKWEKNAKALSYPTSATAALAELVDRGVLSDPERLLTPASVTVTFDSRAGEFKVRGDERASRAFATHFPARDVMAEWSAKGLDVAFGDDFTVEVYRGELARRGEGFQPDGFLIDLFDYQKVDVAVICERTGFAVMAGMGCGKTPVGIAAAHEIMNNRGEVPRTVVVVPPAVRTQWRNEIVRFTGADPDDVVVVDGATKAKRMAAYDAAENARWLIVHYQAAILPDDFKRLEKLCAGSFLICDEFHRLKNYTSKTHKALKRLGSRAARRLGLSGTPVENRVDEWYSVLSGWAVPGIFGDPMDFLNRYSFPGKFGGFEGARNLPELRVRSLPHYVRHTLNEVAPHMPPLRVQTVALDPRPDYAAALRRAHREARDEIAANRLAKSAKAASANALDGYDRDEVETGAQMTAVGMLKLLCCSPRIIAESEADAAVALRDGGLVPDDDGPKLDELRTMAAEMAAAGDRVVVFASSKRMIGLCSARLTEDGIRHVVYTGDTSPADRDAAVAAFTTPATDDDPGPTVFLATDAGAEGLNLGRCCSTLVNLDIPWTPGRLAQRNGRVRRVDSTATGFLVINLVVRGTIEDGILRMVEHKADLADAIFGETGGRKASTGRGGRNIFDEAMAAIDAA